MSSRKGKRAIIIGGGLAGLAAGFYLDGQGWDVILLEKEEEVGGRARSRAEDGFIFDLGAQFIRDSYDQTLKTSISLGLGDALRFSGTPISFLREDGPSGFNPRSPNLLRALPWKALSSRGKLGLVGLLRPLARHYRRYNMRFPQCWTVPAKGRLIDFLEERYSGEVLELIASPITLFTLGAELEDVSAAACLAGSRTAFFDRMGSFKGGIGFIARSLARTVKVITGMNVLGIQRDAGRVVGVSARPLAGGRLRNYKADAVISAVPATVVGGLTGGLGREAEDLLESISYQCEVVANIGMLDEELTPAGPILLPADQGYKASWVATQKAKTWDNAPGGSTQAVCVFSGRAGDEMIGAPEGAIVDASLKVVNNVLGAAVVEPDSLSITRYPLGRPLMGEEHAHRVTDHLRKGSGVGGLFLAGDWTQTPTVEGAIMSGVIAAKHAAGVRVDLPCLGGKNDREKMNIPVR